MNRNRARKQLTNLPTKLSDWTATFDGSIETDLFGGTFSERIAIGRLRPGREECFCINRKLKLFVRIVQFEFLVRFLKFRFVVRHIRFVRIRIIRIIVLFRFWLDLGLWFHNRIFRFDRFRILFRIVIQLVKRSGKQRAVCKG
jgi:hypothetical protein